MEVNDVEEKITMIALRLGLSNVEARTKIQEFCSNTGLQWVFALEKIDIYIQAFGEFPKSLEDLRLRPTINPLRYKSNISLEELRKKLIDAEQDL